MCLYIETRYQGYVISAASYAVGTGFLPSSKWPERELDL